MNEVDVKKLSDQCSRSAYCLGTIIGGLSVILNNLKTPNYYEIKDVYNELKDLQRQAGMQIHEIFYKHLEVGEKDE